MEDELCYFATSGSKERTPLLVLSLPTTPEYDFDDLLEHGLSLIDQQADRSTSGSDTTLSYELLIFCAGKNRPTWPWLLQNFSKLNQRYKKGLKKLYLVHEKSWIRVCMQLLENVVSPKFARKVKHITTLEQLSKVLGATMPLVRIPREAQEYDDMLRHEEHSSKDRRKLLRESVSKGNVLPTGIRAAEKRNIAKRKLSPPLAPPSRHARPQQASIKSQDQVSAPPAVPPRRAQKTTRNISSESLIIFEDAEAEDEEAAAGAAEKAERHLEQILREAGNVTRKMDAFSTPGKRSSSAPTGNETARSSLTTTTTTTTTTTRPSTSDRPQNTLRRAISGPVTPSSTQRQFVLPRALGRGDDADDADAAGPPKLMIRGRARTVRTVAVDARAGGKVGGLKALFEEKALVARSMSTVV